MKRRTVACLLLVLILLAAFSGCKKADSTDKAFAYPVDSDPACLDPQVASGSAALAVLNNCMEGLVRLDGNAKVIPGVAKEISVSGDGLTYTFTLRQDAKWFIPEALRQTEDEPDDKKLPADFPDAVTAQDFIFALRRALDPATKAPDASRLFSIKNAQAVNAGRLPATQLGIQAPDAHTLIIVLERANPEFLQTLSTAVAMPCSEAFFNHTAGRYGLNDDLLLCNGPFYLSKWTEEKSVFLRLNPTYAGDKAVTAKSVNFLVNTDDASRLSLLKKGTYDAAPLSAKYGAQLVGQTGVHLDEYANIIWMIAFNTGDAALANTQLRLALCQAIDPSQLTAPASMAGMAAGLVPGSCYIGETPYRDAAGGARGISCNQSQAALNWSTALKALKQDSLTLQLTLPKEFEPNLRKILEQWQQITDLVSSSFRIDSLDSSAYQAKISGRTYQAALLPMQADSSSALEFLTSFRTGAQGNTLGYSSAEFDKLVDKAALSGSSADYLAAEAFLLQNGVVYPLFTQNSYFALAQNVSGVYRSPLTGSPCFLSAERAGKD